jgi:hypothetical protein
MNNPIQNATVDYRRGLMLIIPKHNNAPLLFLEWLANTRAAMQLIRKIINEDDCFKIRLYAIRADYQKCAAYINANL